MNICKCAFAFFAALLLVQTFFGDMHVLTNVKGSFGSVPAERVMVSANSHTADKPRQVIGVRKGDRIVISAEEDDTWVLGPGDDRECNANGCQKFPNLRAFKYGALVGSIGGKSWFLVGTSLSMTASETGYLYLACHDYPYTDNQGSISVKVDINP